MKWLKSNGYFVGATNDAFVLARVGVSWFTPLLTSATLVKSLLLYYIYYIQLLGFNLLNWFITVVLMTFNYCYSIDYFKWLL